MKPERHTYILEARSWLGLSRPVLVFRTALNLHRIPGLIPRIKATMGGHRIRAVPRRVT